MAITLYNLHKWYKMLTGRSTLHVNQNIGKHYYKDSIGGYYNNLAEKVTKDPIWLESEKIITIKETDGTIVIFPVAVFQYALGCYDLYLETNNDKYLKKFLQLARWTMNAQDDLGRWDNFSYTYPKNPYGAMAQGEGASVLIRAYKETADVAFLNKAKDAIDFMLTPIEEGGTSLYVGNDLLFKEYTHLPVVLNGWIFAWWGLYDFVIVTKDNGFYKKRMLESLRSLINFLPKFDNSFWSNYDLGNIIASPFYHNLHIAQMQAMYILTGEVSFKEYSDMWQKYNCNVLYKVKAFCVKAFQKIRE